MFLFASIFMGFLSGLGLLILAAVLCHRIAKAGGTQDMMSLPGKILLSVGLLGIVGFTFAMGRDSSKGSQAVALFVVIIAAVPLSALWLPHVVGLVLSPLFSSMTGGGEQVERRPFYSRAVALRKRGDFEAAGLEVENQLALFPGDAQGLMLLVDIQAEDLKDVSTAIALLAEMIHTPGRDGSEVALALSRMADLQLNRLSDLAAAKETYQRIVTGFPHTEAANTARQQLAHLPGAEQLAHRVDRPRLVVTHHQDSLGLTADLGAADLPKEDLSAESQRLVTHLNEFPDDWESRELLARIYVDHWHRFDLAGDQLERLINQPGAAPRQVAHWLNDLADVQLKSPAGLPAARLTLERIGQKFPASQWSELAQSRISLLGLDQRAKASPKTLKLGSYEQNIGLQRGDPSIPDPAAHSV